MSLQALHHPEYNITQLVYLKVDYPVDGDLDELCLSFFSEEDKIRGTHYRPYPRTQEAEYQTSADIHMPGGQFARLGVLIIDEV